MSPTRSSTLRLVSKGAIGGGGNVAHEIFELV
jgi:hypothetical protein